MRAEEEESRRWDELGACQDLVSQKSGRKRGTGLLSEKKASRECREETHITAMMTFRFGEAVSAWAAPKR